MYISASTAKMLQRLFCTARLSGICNPPTRRLPNRQHDDELGSQSRFAHNSDVTAVILDDTVGYGQFQTGSSFLGGEEGCKQLFLQFLADSSPVVGDRD